MSTDIRDIIETERASNCCGSSMYELGESYICTDCKEHCEAVEDDSDDSALTSGLELLKFGKSKEIIKHNREFDSKQLEIIAAFEKQCAEHGCDDNGHKHD